MIHPLIALTIHRRVLPSAYHCSPPNEPRRLSPSLSFSLSSHLIVGHPCCFLLIAVRFGRVPKREKARILAAMQQSSHSRSQEKAVAAELEDEQRLLATVVQAHLDTCDFTRDKVAPILVRARETPNYTACPPTLVSIYLVYFSYSIFLSFLFLLLPFDFDVFRPLRIFIIRAYVNTKRTLDHPRSLRSTRKSNQSTSTPNEED